MILSDHTLRAYLKQGIIQMTPCFPEDIQPSSIDVHLGQSFVTFPSTTEPIDLFNPPPSFQEPTTLPDGAAYTILSNQFLLANTQERIVLPDFLVARLEGKSSLARWGLQVHATAGYIDPGFHGTITLELFNSMPFPIVLRVGMRIAQISFATMDRPAERPYGSRGLRSRYQGQQEATPSRLHLVPE